MSQACGAPVAFFLRARYRARKPEIARNGMQRIMRCIVHRNMRSKCEFEIEIEIERN